MPVSSRVAFGCLAACSVVGALLPSAVGAVEEAIAVELLDRARLAAQTESFEGQVVVEWHDGRQRHSAQVPVRSAGGVLRFGDQVVGAGANRMVHGTDGWLSLWGHDVTTLGPSPLDKYRLSVEPGPEVATRPTDMLAVALAGASRPRERLFVDRDSGLLLRREMLDSHGNAYRSVAFTALTTGHTIVAAAVGATPEATRSQEPAPARHLKAPFKLKSRIGSGYRRVGAYKAGGVVQQYFSDGLHGLSVFEQRGHLKAAEKGLAGETGSGRRVEIAGRTMRAYSASVGEAVVWESDGVVYTAVTDAPWSDLAAAVRDLPHADPPGRLRRVAQTVVSLFRWR
jgi:sigma-E factor negative regulatory protein RseB